MVETNDESPVPEAVRVIVRVRPQNKRELQCAKIVVASHENATISIQDSLHNVNCSYDTVFDETATQEEVYDTIKDSVKQVAQGFNATIFAYGQTGTGKTHTMLGKNLEHELQSLVNTPTCNWGIIPRAVQDLFMELKEVGEHGTAAVVHCSYMQIYNNEIYDLLQESHRSKKESLTIREIIKGNSRQVYVSGVSEFRVSSSEDVLRLLEEGGKNRSIRATNFNESSSRSHAVLQLSAEVESRGTECATIIRRAKLNLVDLAGSEKWDTKNAMSEGRTKELLNINKSLSALGNVISALTERRRSHIPYRDSKLTRLLQDSLGGNTRTTVICTLSPVQSAVDETISTLLFADRAKRVIMRVQVNELVDDAALLARAQREIARLKLQVKKLTQENCDPIGTTDKVTDLLNRNKKLQHENAQLKVQIEKLKRNRHQHHPQLQQQKQQSLQHEYPDLPRSIPETRCRQSKGSVGDRESVPSCDDDEEEEHGPSVVHLEHLRQQVNEPKNDLSRSNPSQDVQGISTQSNVIERIQQERRQLEKELEEISQSNIVKGGKEQKNSKNNNEESDGGGDNDDGDDDICPMCHTLIDNHTDEQLDLCIEEEQKSLEQNMAIQQLTRSGSPADERLEHVHPPLEKENSSSSLSCDRRLSGQGSIHELEKGITPVTPKAIKQSTLNHQTSSSVLSTKPTTTKTSSLLVSKKSKGRQIKGSKSKIQVMEDIYAVKSMHLSHEQRNRETNSPRSLKGLGNRKSDNKGPRSSTRKLNIKATGLAFSVGDIGKELEIYKYRYDSWDPCTIVGFDARRNLHCCQYEYGDKQWHDLLNKEYKLMENETSPNNVQEQQTITTLPKEMPEAYHMLMPSSPQIHPIKEIRQQKSFHLEGIPKAKKDRPLTSGK